MSIENIGLSWIVVSDIRAALDFYTKTLGMKLKEFHEQYGWAELSGEDGDSILGIAQVNDTDNIKAGSNAVVTFSVKNLEEAIEKYKKKGVRFQGDVIEVPGHVRMQTCKDIDGNTFQLVERI